MASKTASGGSKKTPPKKKSGTGSGKKPTAPEKTAKKQPDGEELAARRQVVSIILFAVSLFIGAVVFINSDGGLWGIFRTGLFGLFGFAAYILPFALIALDVMILLEKLSTRVAYKVAECVVLLTLIVAFVHIVKTDGELAFAEQIKEGFNTYYKLRVTSGAGGLGALVGGGLLAATGGNKVAAGITDGILFFVVFMLFTGTTLIKLFNTMTKPVKKVEEYTEDKIEQFREAGIKDVSDAEVVGDELDVVLSAAERRRAKREAKAASAEKPAPAGSDIDIPLDAAPPKEDMGIDGFFAGTDKKTVGSVSASPEQADAQSAAREPQAPAVLLDDIIRRGRPEKSEAEKKSDKQTAAEKAADSEKTEEELREYQLPPLDCLKEPSHSGNRDYSDELKENARKIVQTLNSFGVSTRIVDICRSPSVTRYELQPDPGVKISRITNLADDLALSLAAAGVRIEAPIPNKSAVGIEVPNKERNMVTLREIIDTDEFKKAKSKLNVALGRDIQGTPTYADLSKMPHLLIAGTTGSGKSVCTNTMILSILFNAKPDEVKFIMIDPKSVEYTMYNGIPQLLVPVVSDAKKASGALAWAVTEMEKRYKLFSECGVRNLQGYNALAEAKGEAKIPQIVIFIDEFSDLMMVASNEVENSICRLAQKARAAGMHLVIATQRPSVDVITGLIKANIPSRLALSVSSPLESRIILDCTGADKLLGNGDMLFCPIGTSKPVRIQGAYVSEDEIESIVSFIKGQAQTHYDDEVIEEIERQVAEAANKGKKKLGGDIEFGAEDDDSDEMLPKAIEVVVEAGMASTTLLQKRLKLGYARASRIVDDLAERGIVGPYEGSKPRKVLITKEQWYEMKALSENTAPKQVTYDEIIERSGGRDVLADDDDDDVLREERNYFGGAADTREDDDEA